MTTGRVSHTGGETPLEITSILFGMPNAAPMADGETHVVILPFREVPSMLELELLGLSFNLAGHPLVAECN